MKEHVSEPKLEHEMKSIIEFYIDPVLELFIKYCNKTFQFESTIKNFQELE